MGVPVSGRKINGRLTEFFNAICMICIKLKYRNLFDFSKLKIKGRVERV